MVKTVQLPAFRHPSVTRLAHRPARMATGAMGPATGAAGMRVFVPVEDEVPAGVKLVPYRIGMALLSFTIEAPSPAERAAAQAPARAQRVDPPAVESPLAA